jgi:hypothetical protein
VEEGEGVVLRVHLRVVAARRQIRTSQSGQFDRLPRHRQLAREDLADERFRCRIGRIVDHEPARTQNLFEPAAERIGHPGARRVGAPQRRQQRFLEFSGRKNRAQIRERFVNAVIESDGRDRHWSAPGRGGQRQRARRQLAVEHRTRSDFLPVVVFRIDPEDGDCRHLMVARDLFRQFQRGDGLSRVNSGPPKSPACWPVTTATVFPVGEEARRLACARRGLSPLLLSSQDRRNLRAPAIVGLCSRDRLRPGGAIGWIAGKKWRDRSKVVRVVGGQAPDPREPANVDRHAHGSIGVRPGLRV